MKHQANTPAFSDYLFWDAAKDKIDFDKNKAYVIERVLSHGMLSDWYALKALYGKETIREVVLQIRHLDKYALHFCAAYFNEPLEQFRCYNYAQSIPVHWDY
jgi:hypothetical protein